MQPKFLDKLSLAAIKRPALESYQDIKKYIINQNIIIDGGLVTSDDIYEFQNDQLSEIFQGYFNFCLENLRTKCEKYKIELSSIYFEDNLRVNAKAGLTEDNYIIAINMGVVAILYLFFIDEQFDFSNPVFEKFKAVEDFCDSSPEYLMYQTATQFTFYHELAHLIQKSEILKIGFIESYENEKQNAFSLEHHLLEIDADLWAAHFVCYHIIQYFKKQEDAFKVKENLETLLILSLASIFVYFIFLLGDRFVIYFKDNLHPHPSIRILYLIDSFLSIAHDSFKGEFDIDKSYLLAETFRVAEEMFKTKRPEINTVETMLKELFDSFPFVKLYMDEMQLEIKKRPYLLLNNYDKLIND